MLTYRQYLGILVALEKFPPRSCCVLMIEWLIKRVHLTRIFLELLEAQFLELLCAAFPLYERRVLSMENLILCDCNQALRHLFEGFHMPNSREVRLQGRL